MPEQFVFQQLPTVPMDEGPNQYPTIATVREIDIEATADWVSFFFSRGTYFVDLTTYSGGFDGLLRDLRNDAFIFEDDTFNNRPDPPATPLSLNNQGPSYVVYKLADKNWQFCRNHPPFSIGPKLQNSKLYCEARRIAPWGAKERIVQDPVTEEWSPVTDRSMIAYFIADGFAALGTTGIYTHAINIHVDLVFRAATPAYTPLIIDPDVRHPGGSGA